VVTRIIVLKIAIGCSKNKEKREEKRREKKIYIIYKEI